MALQRDPRAPRPWRATPFIIGRVVEVYLPTEPYPTLLGIVQDQMALEAWLERIPERFPVIALDRIRGFVARERIACRRDGRVRYSELNGVSVVVDIPSAYEPVERN
jgi:hypothetical protein